MRTGEVGVQLRGELELDDGRVALAGDLIEVAQVVMRDWLVGDELHHLLELLDGALVLRVLLEGDPEVEPGVRDRRILLLRALELGDPLLRAAGSQQREAVVHALAR
jgi:hypothetical protein